MKSLQRYLLCAFTCFLSLYAFASEAKWSIKGTIKEQQTDETISYATVALFSKGDSSLITGSISDEEGNFALGKIEQGNYFLTINFIGYEDYIIDPLVLNPSDRTLDLGVLQLRPNVETLTEVVVTSNARAIRNTVDKQVMRVSSNLVATGGTAVDALKLSPSIQSSSDGTIKLRGSAKFIVLINGKPTSLEANEVLTQTPANLIREIEIITNPSVKYNAEGGAGIINIILKKNVAAGLNGMVNARIGTKDKYSADVNMNINKEKVSYSFGMDWRDYTKVAQNNYYRTTTKEDETHYASMLQDRQFTDSNLGFRFGLDYNPNEKYNLNYAFHTGYNKIEGQVLNTNAGYTVPTRITENKYNPFYLTQKPVFHTSNLGYNKAINDGGDNLSLNLYYSFIDYHLSNHQSSHSTDEDGVIIDNTPYRLHVLNKNYSNDIKLDADYTLSISGTTTIETGMSYRLYNRFLNINYTEFDYIKNDWINHPDYTNKYNFDETIYGGYVNINASFWGLSTSFGLRMEYTDRLLQRKYSDEKYVYEKANFFPGFTIAKNLDNASIKLALSNRINRPDEYYMNPFPEFQDDYFYAEGNPYLTPEIVRNVELGYNVSKDNASFSSSLYYRQTKDKIDQKLTNGDDGRTYVVFHNESKDRTIGLEAMLNYDASDWWSINANVNVFHYEINAIINRQEANARRVSWTSQLVNSFDLNETMSIQLISYYASKTARSQGELSDYFFMDIAVGKEFCDGRLSVNLQLKDVFQSMNYELSTSTGNMNLLGDFNNESPIFLFNVSYKLNTYNKKTKDAETKFDM